MNAVGILNAKPENWAFEKLAQNLSRILNLPIQTISSERNYVLYYPEAKIESIKNKSFIRNSSRNCHGVEEHRTVSLYLGDLVEEEED